MNFLDSWNKCEAVTNYNKGVSKKYKPNTDIVIRRSSNFYVLRLKSCFFVFFEDPEKLGA